MLAFIEKYFMYTVFSLMLLGFPMMSHANPVNIYKQSAVDIAKYPEIHYTLLKKALNVHQVFLIDANSEGSYRKGHIPGAHSFAMPGLEQHLPVLKSYLITTEYQPALRAFLA